MRDVTRHSGFIMIHGNKPKQLGFGASGPPHAKNLCTVADFNDVFAGCDVLVCEEYEAEQCSGSAHVGMSALIEFVVRKPV